jgi:inosine/xanthosine triphosphatase
MITIVVASKNPVKLEAAERAFLKLFPGELCRVEGVSVDSGVGTQPMSDEETFRGAWNRAERAQAAMPQADLWVGMEGGVQEKNGELESFAWMIVRGADGRVGKGRTATLFLPKRVADLVRQGKELGEADDEVFGTANSKQVNGATGLLTGNVVTRADYYTEALVLAMIPRKNPSLYL